MATIAVRTIKNPCLHLPFEKYYFEHWQYSRHLALPRAHDGDEAGMNPKKVPNPVWEGNA